MFYCFFFSFTKGTKFIFNNFHFKILLVYRYAFSDILFADSQTHTHIHEHRKKNKQKQLTQLRRV